MKNTKYFVMFMLLLISVSGMIASCADAGVTSDNTKDVTNFDECAAAGNPVMESYPRQCRTIDGKTFVEETGEGKMPGSYTKEINISRGTLFLTYSGGKATLTGVLQRGTPCTEFDVQVISTRDMPTSNVNINIYDKNKGVMCIQMLGEPQEISVEILSVSENTRYSVTYEQTEELFNGKLGETK